MLALACLLTSAACAPERADLADASAGAYTPAQWTEREAWTVGASTLEIGEIAGAEAYHFVDVVAGTRLENGDMVVADAGSRRVRRYDAVGRYIDDLGAPGEGPGEFRRPSQVSNNGDGQFTVWDAGHWRLSRFDSSGEHVGDETVGIAGFMNVAAPPLYPSSAHALGAGEWVVRLDAKSGAASKDAAPSSADPLASAEAAGVVRATAELEARLLWTMAGEEQVIVDAPWGPQPMPPPLARDLRLAVQPGGGWFCVGDQREPTVRCSGPEAAERVIEWKAPPLPLGSAEQDISRWRESTEETYGQKLAVDEVRRLMAQIPIPTARPPYAEIHLDVAGHLWVERGPVRTGVDYLVFGPGGQLLGHVELPDVHILEIGADYILAVRSDALGVQYLQVLPLMKPS